MDTPVPIPNTEVKHFNADGSTFDRARVGSCQALSLIKITYAYLAQLVRAPDCLSGGREFKSLSGRH